jgi:glycosyltransferase involved in cell wall biosynthesis
MTDNLTVAGATFVCSVTSRAVLENNLLVSPCLGASQPHQILLQENFTSAAKAYNSALEKSDHDLVIFVHQDVIFPSAWLFQLQQAIRSLERTDPNWGVLGVFGKTANGSDVGHIYSNGLGIIGSPFQSAQPIQTLDEIVLIFRKSSGLKFDERLPHFHFYGAGICLAALEKGKQSYAIPAFCIHNTQFNLVLPEEFYASYRALKNISKKYLPIQTTCVRMTRFDSDMYRRRLREFVLRYFRRTTIGAFRRENVKQLLTELESAAA